MTEPDASDRFRFEVLSPEHDRASFTCGVPELDIYLARQARQDADRNLASVCVMTPDGSMIAGYYTLSASAVMPEELPIAFARKLPRHPVPATLLGRMAVSSAQRGRGLGEVLLMHALRRALVGASGVASWAVIVDAKQGARDFYLKYTFLPLPNRPERLFLPMREIEELLP